MSEIFNRKNKPRVWVHFLKFGFLHLLFSTKLKCIFKVFLYISWSSKMCFQLVFSFRTVISISDYHTWVVVIYCQSFGHSATSLLKKNQSIIFNNLKRYQQFSPSKSTFLKNLQVELISSKEIGTISSFKYQEIKL